MEENLQAFLTAALGHDRVYPLILPQKPTLPAVAYQRIDASDELTSDGIADLVEGRFQLDAYGKTYPDARTTARSIRTALSGYRGEMGTTWVDSARKDTESGAYEPETRLFRVSMDFIIFFKE